MNPVEENLVCLVSEMSKADLDKQQIIEIYDSLLKTIIYNNVTDSERYGASMTVADYIKKVRNANRKASGFFGNWAKYVEEKDQDVGC